MTATSPDPPRWRFTVHRRDFGTPTVAHQSGLGELVGARSRRLETTLNGPAKLTWTTDGRAPSSALPVELATDVMAWRDGRLMFRGVIAMAEDTVSEQSHAVNWTAFDYLSVLERRYLTGPTDVTYTQTDQDAIIADLVTRATTGATAGTTGHSFSPGSLVPLVVARTNPDGTARPASSGIIRDRTYTGGKSIGEAIVDMTGISQGVDISVEAAADVDGLDRLRVWFSGRGELRDDLALVYGTTVASLTRSINSQTYANYARVLGQGDATQGAPQLIAEQWSQEAGSAGGTFPVGLWPTVDQQPDVSILSTLQARADGLVDTMGVLTPSYSLVLRPGWFRPGRPDLGDTVPLIVAAPPRLNVSTTQRVTALNYVIGDDGQEDVELTVGRPALPLSAAFTALRRDIGALARR